MRDEAVFSLFADRRDGRGYVRWYLYPQASAPANARNGDLAVANGTNWNPDSTGVGGLFQYNGTTWVRCSLTTALTALAALTPAADKVPYFTSGTAAALADFTSFGRSLVDDANAAAGRTTLGLGSIATQNANSVDIDGGAIDGTPVGANSASTGAFTTLTASTTTLTSGSGQLTLSGATASLILDESDQAADARKWAVVVSGGSLTLRTFADDLTTQNTWATVDRSTGGVAIPGRFALGAATVSTVGMELSRTVTGGTTAMAGRANGTIQSDVTVAGEGFRSSISTAATSFTLTNLRHFHAREGTIGAGSTVTNQYGFLASSTLTGATNNYGFYSELATAAGRYNVYSAGTAPNHFTGLTTFGAKFGYGTTSGVGGTVTQATSKSTGVTLNTPTGAITMNGAALAANTVVTFTLTNSSIEADDVLILSHKSVGTLGDYVFSHRCASGSASIAVRNVTAGSLSEAIVIQYAVVRGAIA